MNKKNFHKICFIFLVLISASCYVYLSFQGSEGQPFIQSLASSDIGADISELSEVNIVKNALVKVVEFITL